MLNAFHAASVAPRRRFLLTLFALALVGLSLSASAGGDVDASVGPVVVQDWSYPPKGLSVRPTAGGGMFLDGKPIEFRLRWKPKDKNAPRAVTVAAQVQHFYGRSPVKDAVMTTTLDAQGKGTLTGTFDLPRGPYRLAITISDDDKTLATGGLDFALAGPTPPAPKDVDAEWLACCTQFQWHPGKVHFGRQLAALQRIGFRWVRFNNYLDVPGQKFHQKKIKHIIDQLARRDIEFFQLVLSTPKALQGAPESAKGREYRWPPKSFDQWQAALKRCMENFGPKSHRYEIWNEPAGHFIHMDGTEGRFPGGKDQIIYQGLRRAVDVAKQMDFPVTIAGPGSVPWAYNVNERILAEHGAFWDVLTLHYREESFQIGGAVQLGKRIVDRYSDGKMKIWFTEAQTSSGLWGEDRMAWELKKYTRMWMEQLGDKFFHFDFSHPMRNKRDVGRSSLVNYKTLMAGPGAVTFQQMLRATRDAQAIGPILFDTPDREGYLYMKDSKPCALVWSLVYDETAPIPAELIGPETTARDMYGNAVPTDQPCKLYRPVYLETIRTDAESVQQALVRLQPFIFRIDQNSKNYLHLGLANPSAEPKTYRVTFPAGPITVTPAEVNVTLQPGQARSIPVTLTAGDLDRSGPIAWTGTVNGKPTLLARLYLYDTGEIKTLTIDPAQNGWKPLPPFQKPFRLDDPDNLDNADPLAIVEHKDVREFGQPVSTEWLGPFEPTWRGLPEETPQLQICKVTDAGLLCWADWRSSKGHTLDASFGPEKRIPLPGMAIEARVTVELTPEMIHDGHLRVLVGLRDADGFLHRFLASKELIAKPGPQTLSIPISSPLRRVYRDSTHGGASYFMNMNYPVTFEGVGLGMTNVRHLPEGRFRFGAVIKDVQFRYVDRPADVKKSVDHLVPITGPMGSDEPRRPVLHWNMDPAQSPTASAGGSAVPGKLGQATHWQADEPGHLADTDAPARIRETLTLDAWVKLGAYPTGKEGDRVAWIAGAGRAFALVVRPDGRLEGRLQLFFNGRRQRLVSDAFLPLGQWVRVTLAYDGTLGRAAMFINGERVAEKELFIIMTSRVESKYDTFTVRSPDGKTDRLAGAIDEVTLRDTVELFGQPFTPRNDIVLHNLRYRGSILVGIAPSSVPAPVAESYLIRLVRTDGQRLIEVRCSGEDLLAGAELPLLDDFPAGEYRLSLWALNPDGSPGPLVLDRTFRHTPPDRTTWDIRNDGVLLKQGKPFFPIGMYHVHRKDYDLFATGGFNTLMPTPLSYSVGVPKRAEELGLHILARGFRNLDPGMGLWRNMPKYKNNPAILAWYLDDEPSGHDRDPAIIQDRYERTNRRDPTHPVFLLDNAPAGFARFAPACDIFAADPYPFHHFHGRTVAQQTRQAVDAVFGKKPVWVALQYSTYAPLEEPEVPWCDIPSPEKIRCESYMALACGARGLLYYAFDDSHVKKAHVRGTHLPKGYPDAWKVLVALAAEIKSRKHLWVAPYAETISVENLTPLLVVAEEAFLHDGKAYLLAVNPDAKATHTLRLRLTGVNIKNDQAIPDDLGSKPARVDRKTIVDTLGPYQVKLYVLPLEQSDKEIPAD